MYGRACSPKHPPAPTTCGATASTSAHGLDRRAAAAVPTLAADITGIST
ncbi:hypothetical protein ACFPFX_25460 [Streptomyces mauvecolor]|uniref:Uncharacterized protein n=1 Tax=Streptomyces mauvecolor TaxID=58345 RepID=A0ABV9US87_9ACTN